MILRAIEDSDAGALAGVHLMAFDDAWREADIASLINGLGGYGFAVEGSAGLTGFILCRAIAGEAEVLTLAVAPVDRRQGYAAALLQAALDAAAGRDASAVFLEVAADNAAAIGLYEKAGFARIGVRGGYYRRDKVAIDALVLRRDLNT